MSKDNVFLVAVIDHMADAVKHAVHNSQPRNLALLRQNVQRGQKIMESWMENHGGTILLASGEEICAELPGSNLEDLPQLHSEVQDAWSDSITFGIGLDLKEALKACQEGKKRGGGRIVFYAPEIEEHLNEESRSESHDAKNNDGDPDELKEFGLSKANSPSPGPPTPNQSMSPFGPGSAQPSGADMPPPPSATNAAGGLSAVEQQMRQMASGGEAQAARSQAQAQVADDGTGGGDAEQLKQGMARILMKVKEQLPVLEQLKEQAPEAYTAILGMVQVVATIAKQLGGGKQEQPKQEPVAKAYITSNDRNHILRQSTGINNAVNYTLDSTLDTEKEELEPHSPVRYTSKLDKIRKAAMMKRAITPDDIEEASSVEEEEHHLGPAVSTKIAGDHLNEDPDYYRDELAKEVFHGEDEEFKRWKAERAKKVPAPTLPAVPAPKIPMKKDALPMPEEQVRARPPVINGGKHIKTSGKTSTLLTEVLHEDPAAVVHRATVTDGSTEPIAAPTYIQEQAGRVRPADNLGEAMTGYYHSRSSKHPSDQTKPDEQDQQQDMPVEQR
jgi:hypothetical protein